jgi:hypothetical protein
LISVLDDFGFANLGLGRPDFVERDQIIQLGRPPNRIDLLTGIAGVKFEEACSTRPTEDCRSNTRPLDLGALSV